MQIITIVLMVRRAWRIWTSAYAVLLPLLDVAWSSAMMSSLTGQPIEHFAHAMAPEAMSNCIAAMIMAGIWSLYLTRSRRVANTFIRHITPATPAEPA
jgi:hypothetical protein